MAEENSEAVVYLHGDLDLKIIQAWFLPIMDLVSERLFWFFTAFKTCHASCTHGRQNKHKAHQKIITSDPYVSVCLGGARVARTRIISNSQNPIWNEHFKIPLAHPVSHVEFVIKDNDMFGADLIGVTTVSAQRILTDEFISDWFPMIGSFGKPSKPNTAIRLEMKFTRCEDNPLYRFGISTDPNGYRIGNCYFSVRKGGSVTLYQDAHVTDSMLEKVELENGSSYQHEKCLLDHYPIYGPIYLINVN